MLGAHMDDMRWCAKKFLGVKPLPGFANIMNETESGVLVTFIGFEGRRSRQITSPFDPIPKILPIVGLPGFRIEYPTYTIACNRDFIDEQRAFGKGVVPPQIRRSV